MSDARCDEVLQHGGRCGHGPRFRVIGWRLDGSDAFVCGVHANALASRGVKTTRIQPLRGVRA